MSPFLAPVLLLTFVRGMSMVASLGFVMVNVDSLFGN